MLYRTPVETYRLTSGRTVWVKREDLCVGAVGPPFSKVRGLMAFLRKIKSCGVKHVGYVETSVSMAGWGVAWVCQELGMEAVIFDPQYKDESDMILLQYHRSMWDKFGAVRIPIPAGRAKVNYHKASKIMKEMFDGGGGAILLPLGLPFKETVDETEYEALETSYPGRVDHVVLCIGSGTIASGLCRVFRSVVGVMSRTGNTERMFRRIEGKACRPLVNEHRVLGFQLGVHQLHIVDPGWEYTEPSAHPCPFPCHSWYDRKAWEWLDENEEELEGNILFWNIGRSPLE